MIAPLFAFCAAVLMALFVLARRHKDPFHWMLSGFLVGLVLWTGGVLWRLTTPDEVQLAAAVRVIMVGILLSASFWLLTALAYAEERGGAVRARATVIVLSAAVLFAMAMLTNDVHRLFLRRVDFEALSRGPRAYVGPLFWVFLAWAYGCVGAGLAVYLRAAGGMLRTESRRRGWALALASVLPAAASTLYVFQPIPVPYDLTPVGLVAAVGLIWVAVVRYRLFESLPLAREAVLAHLDDGVVMASAGGGITRWNPAAERLFAPTAIARHEPLGDALARLLPAWPVATAPDAATVALRTPDGRLLEVTMAEVDTGHGEVAGRFAILSDRTEADRVEKVARQTQRLEIVGALAAEIAQEISEPLARTRASLIGIEALGALANDVGDAKLDEELADLRSVAQETLEGVERMQRIVEGMRELSTVERGGFARVDLVSVVRDALRLSRIEEGDPRIELVLSLDPVPPVQGDADRLVQVVLNLLVNARHALCDVAAPRIEVSIRADAGFVRLIVRDNGPGIPDALRDRVFDPFFTTRGPDEGTGLGLAIAFDIAREHDGMLEECSGSAGGACFALRIPSRAERRAGRRGPG